ncbi:ABC transporter permease [Paenibacillus beijingensis]|uniref:ABC transmembrane type-1 domain-containing protein n=1 Tax=Paenibacillus beijingensis TaxID=1126833 RepID=A0A0D5NEK2_9BACL|nr:ABC transporter permease [Paenibacillus beijingensis]AJY73402.1 hypothetical protein VN24_00615 [Paenibacillus beijingensis]
MNYLVKNLDKVMGLFVDHVVLVVISLFLSVCIAVPIAAVISKFAKSQAPVIGTFGIIYTVPSLALFSFLIPVFGLGLKPAVIALILYSQMILVRNMVAGIKGIDPSIFEAAKGMGMDKWRIFRKITVPLALPVIIAGIRIAAISMIGTATIAAFINAGGLGKLIFEGIYQDNSGKIIAGTIAVIILAVTTEVSLRLLEWKVSLKTR